VLLEVPVSSYSGRVAFRLLFASGDILGGLDSICSFRLL
jgi:hypothetical protein